eukprot:TRINITY_DN9757_c0_g1_i1.p1 TRINITY_DN9757_c0_g1~~TRINITY_DN9757_c0_g1_i1.p1  ORF type:complete len:334 (+),score=60.25 TRINITY_DN9757_c0_g1_i1:627-1628(+)
MRRRLHRHVVAGSRVASEMAVSPCCCRRRLDLPRSQRNLIQVAIRSSPHCKAHEKSVSLWLKMITFRTVAPSSVHQPTCALFVTGQPGPSSNKSVSTLLEAETMDLETTTWVEVGGGEFQWQCNECTTLNRDKSGVFNCSSCDHYQFRQPRQDKDWQRLLEKLVDPKKIIVEECKGFPEVYDPDLRTRYYTFNLRKYVDFVELPGDVLKVIVHFAATGYNIGDLVEAKDSVAKWYTAEVIAVAEGRIRVHFHGWAAKFDEWIPTDSNDRLAPLMTNTYGTPRMVTNAYKPVLVKEDLLAQLVSMGFTEKQAKNSLCATRNNLETAIARLKHFK